MGEIDAVEVGAGAGDDAQGGAGSTPWLAFGDLMAGLLGAFVLVVVALVASQLELTDQLTREQEQRQAEEQRRLALEQALAGPLAAGRVTLDNGRIGISGSVLFAFNSDQLQPEGRQLLRSLAGPLGAYLGARDELLMVSGFTDDRQVLGANRRFADNWELSAQRALTVTRALIDAGVPASRVFAAAFGAQQPVASNDDAQGRALNRRVEIAPTPRVAAAVQGRQP
jgi:flagellar motor protein MotB